MNVLASIRKGMKVYDPAQHHIGTVDFVKLSDEDPDEPETEISDISQVELEGAQHSIIEDFADAFRPEDLPVEMRERLLREGFIRIDAAGLFAGERYALPEQIQSVAGDRVVLSTGKDELIKRH
jgi:hypothetical protein